MDYSKTFGPTDSVAGTKTTVGAAAELLNKDVTIHRIRVGKGNVVNAKECAGKITIEATGLEGTHVYAYGNGAGGATNSGNMAAEPIDCSIPISANSKVTVSVTDAEAAKDVVVSLEFHPGKGRNVRSYAVGGAGQDTTADDPPLTLTTSPVMEQGGMIKEIRFAGSGVVDADAGSGRLKLNVPGLSGPFEYSVGNGPGGATLSGPAWADVIDLPHGIPVKKNDTVTITIETPEIMLSATASIQVV